MNNNRRFLRFKHRSFLGGWVGVQLCLFTFYISYDHHTAATGPVCHIRRRMSKQGPYDHHAVSVSASQDHRVMFSLYLYTLGGNDARLS